MKKRLKLVKMILSGSILVNRVIMGPNGSRGGIPFPSEHESSSFFLFFLFLSFFRDESGKFNLFGSSQL